MNTEYYASTDPSRPFNIGPYTNPQDACEACFKDWNIGSSNAIETDGAKRNPVMYCGILVPYVPAIDASDILDTLSVQAGSECGESADGWLEVEFEERKRFESALNLVLDGWLHSIGEFPKFGSMQDVTKYYRSEERQWIAITEKPLTWKSKFEGVKFEVDPNPIRFNEPLPDGRLDVAQTCIHGNLRDHPCDHCGRA